MHNNKQQHCSEKFKWVHIKHVLLNFHSGFISVALSKLLLFSALSAICTLYEYVKKLPDKINCKRVQFINLQQ